MKNAFVIATLVFNEMEGKSLCFGKWPYLVLIL